MIQSSIDNIKTKFIDDNNITIISDLCYLGDLCYLTSKKYKLNNKNCFGLIK